MIVSHTIRVAWSWWIIFGRNAVRGRIWTWTLPLSTNPTIMEQKTTLAHNKIHVHTHAYGQTRMHLSHIRTDKLKNWCHCSFKGDKFLRNIFFMTLLTFKKYTSSSLIQYWPLSFPSPSWSPTELIPSYTLRHSAMKQLNFLFSSCSVVVSLSSGFISKKIQKTWGIELHYLKKIQFLSCSVFGIFSKGMTTKAQLKFVRRDCLGLEPVQWL